MTPFAAILFDQPAKRGVQFRCTTSDIDRLWCCGANKVQGQLRSMTIQNLRAFGPGFDMTVQACLVTQFADVDLHCVDRKPMQ